MCENVKVIETTEREMKMMFWNQYEFLKQCWAHYVYGIYVHIYYVHDVDDAEFEMIKDAIMAKEEYQNEIWIYRS